MLYLPTPNLNFLFFSHKRWADSHFNNKLEDTALANHKSIMAEDNECTIDNLTPGMLYKIVVEAIVSVKDTVTAVNDPKDPEIEKQNRRTTHVMSKPVLVRTKAPCEKPVPIITGKENCIVYLCSQTNEISTVVF